MKKLMFTALLGCFTAANAAPTDTCGMQAAKLIASGDLVAAARLFADPPAMEASLRETRERVGELRELRRAAKPRFVGQHQQYAPAVKVDGIVYLQDWIDAESSKVGPVQLEFVATQAQPCSIVTIKVNYMSPGWSK